MDEVAPGREERRREVLAPRLERQHGLEPCDAAARDEHARRAAHPRDSRYGATRRPATLWAGHQRKPSPAVDVGGAVGRRSR